MPPSKTHFFSTPLKRQKPLKRESKITCQQRALDAWHLYAQGASGGAMYMPKEMISPMVCSDLRDEVWEDFPYMYDFYLPETIHQSATSNPLEIIWKGAPFNGPPPKNFARQQKNYIKVPEEGIRLTCTRGCPTFPAQVVEDLANLNGRVVARPGKDRAFIEREARSDVEATDLAYFITPSLFTPLDPLDALDALDEASESSSNDNASESSEATGDSGEYSSEEYEWTH